MTSKASEHLAQISSIQKSIKETEQKVQKLHDNFIELKQVLEDDMNSRNAMIERKKKNREKLSGDGLDDIHVNIAQFEARIVKTLNEMKETKKEIEQLEALIDVKLATIDAILEEAGLE